MAMVWPLKAPRMQQSHLLAKLLQLMPLLLLTPHFSSFCCCCCSSCRSDRLVMGSKAGDTSKLSLALNSFVAYPFNHNVHAPNESKLLKYAQPTQFHDCC